MSIERIVLRKKYYDGNMVRDAVMSVTEDYNTIMELLKAFSDQPPLIDVIEVVRCKDCRWYEIYQLKKDGTEDRRYKPSYCTLLRHNFTPDWFCADGEVRDDDTD